MDLTERNGERETYTIRLDFTVSSSQYSTPTSRDDPACALPNLTEYIAAIQRLDDQDKSVENRLFSATSNM